MVVYYVVGVVAITWLVLVNLLSYCMNENSYLARKIGFHGALTVSNRAKGVRKDQRPEQFFAWDLLDPKSLVSGHCVGPIPILVYRVFVLLAYIFNIVYQGVLGVGLDEKWLTFFTYWTFTLMALYALLGIIVCSKAVSGKYEAKWGPLEKTFIFVFLSACSCGIFLTIFYWAVLYNGGQVTVYDVIYHGGNIVLMVGELLLSKIPICNYHLQIAFHYLGVYAVFFWIYFWATGFWVYSALAFNSYINLVNYILLPILLALSFYFMHLLAFVRDRAFGRCSEEDEPEQKPSLETLL